MMMMMIYFTLQYNHYLYIWKIKVAKILLHWSVIDHTIFFPKEIISNSLYTCMLQFILQKYLENITCSSKKNVSIGTYIS